MTKTLFLVVLILVAFDLGACGLLFCQRILGAAKGFGFRHDWFRTLKGAGRRLNEIH